MPHFKFSDFATHAKGTSLSAVLGYSTPRLHEGKRWYIDFIAFHPGESVMKRKKYMVPAAGSVRERRELAAQIIFSLNAALRSGWSPWTGGGAGLRAVPWKRIKREYPDYIYHLFSRQALKKSTYNSYQSHFRTLCSYLESDKVSICYVQQLNKKVLVDFLDSLILMNDVSSRTRNNYLVWLSTFCGWLVDREMLDYNPTDGIRKMKEDVKYREQFTAEQLHTLRTYLLEHDRHFLLACLFEYYTFIRPEELCSVTIGDISIKDMAVSLHGEFTKNRRDGTVGLNEEIVKLMVDIGTFSAPSHYFLFGTRDFFPSPRKQSGRIFRERFQKLRKELKWPGQYQFYSLKDTGIRDLANAEGIVIARDQARHTDISTTNKYLKSSASVHSETQHFKGDL